MIEKEVVIEKKEKSESPSKKRLSKELLKGDWIQQMLEKRAAAIGAQKRQRVE